MRVETAEQIVRISKTASKDETRPHICGVYVTPKVMYACTGYAGASVKVDDESITDNMFFTHPSIKFLKNLVIHAKTMGQKLLPVESYQGIIKENEGFPHKFLESNIIEKGNGKKIKCDAKVLFDLVTAMQTCSTKKQNYIIEINCHDKKPCLVTLVNNERGIIMPVI